MKPPTNTVGGGRDQAAVIGHAPEARDWKPGDPAWQPIIAPTARVEAFVTVDAGVSRPTRVGDGSWLMKHVHLGHDVIVGDRCELAPGTVVGGYAILCDDVKVGVNATILPRVMVGKGARVGAGAVVTRSVLPGQTVVGNPARPLVKEA